MTALGSARWRSPKPSELAEGWDSRGVLGCLCLSTGHACGVKTVFYVNYRVKTVMGG